MASSPRGTIWKAEPHTIAKIEILQSYLRIYFLILGSTRRDQVLTCVDGFSGPGEYLNYPEGSPLAAISAAEEVIRQSADRWIANGISFFFMDHDASRIAHLDSLLARRSKVPRITHETLNLSFVDGLAAVRKKRPAAFTTNQPLFVFIDPFGATGVPFEAVQEILSAQCSEVLINLDADGIVRILLAEGHANHAAHLTTLFGDESWRSDLTAQDVNLMCRQVLDLYKRRLRSLPDVRYVFSFEMCGTKNSLNYFLVFASRHPLGLEKMKEAMRAIDKSGQYRFSDGSIGQEMMFRFDDPADFAKQLHKDFRGTEQSRRAIVDYTLNDTPFVNPQKMLDYLEKLGQIAAVPATSNRKRGNFSENAIRAVKFLDREPKSTMNDGGLFDGNQV